jgi:hypothetical protein
MNAAAGTELFEPVEDLETLPRLEVSEFTTPDFGWQKRGSLLDATLSSFGVLLWSYVVAGELVVGVGLPELAAVLGVLGAFGRAWYSAVAPWRGNTSSLRLVVPGFLAIGAFFATLLFACSVSGHSNAEVQAVSLALWFFAVFAFCVGRERARRRAAAATPLSSEQRAIRFASWLVAGLVTSSALIVGLSRL